MAIVTIISMSVNPSAVFVCMTVTSACTNKPDSLAVSKHCREAMKAAAATHQSIQCKRESCDLHDESLSATPHRLAVNVMRAIGDTWQSDGNIARRRSDYRLSGPENQTVLGVKLERILTARWRLAARYGHTDNATGSADFNYRSNPVSIGVEAFL